MRLILSTPNSTSTKRFNFPVIIFRKSIPERVHERSTVGEETPGGGSYSVYNIISSLSGPLHVVSGLAGQINTIVPVTMEKSCDSMERIFNDIYCGHRTLFSAVFGVLSSAPPHLTPSWKFHIVFRDLVRVPMFDRKFKILNLLLIWRKRKTKKEFDRAKKLANGYSISDNTASAIFAKHKYILCSLCVNERMVVMS